MVSVCVAMSEQLAQDQGLTGTPTNLNLSLQTYSHCMKSLVLCSLYHICPANRTTWPYQIVMTFLTYVCGICMC